ncbi:hypothetical protein IFM89_027326 [Coptis chinensis]|uniref:CCHC-type domain-containing protein n=1 Tax=Coptis chinensis TaxID=261450 RepID=A0A835LWS4_9MAGN|nr:hypothetical protein IFM89_027326 [Coptis chinensis]
MELREIKEMLSQLVPNYRRTVTVEEQLVPRDEDDAPSDHSLHSSSPDVDVRDPPAPHQRSHTTFRPHSPQFLAIRNIVIAFSMGVCCRPQQSLRKPLREALAFKDVYDMSDAIKYALKVEDLLRSSPSATTSATSTHVPSSSKPSPTRVGPITCYECKEIGHVRSDCPKRKRVGLTQDEENLTHPEEDQNLLVNLVGGELIETVVAHDVIRRLMIQCALQPGLAQVSLKLDVVETSNEVLVIAEDDNTYTPGRLPELRGGYFPTQFTPKKYPERILFVGWRRDIDDMIMVLEALLAPGSELWMFNDVLEKEREKKLTDGGLEILGLANIKLVHREGNAVIRRHLESLPLETFDSVSVIFPLEDNEVGVVFCIYLLHFSKCLPSKETSNPMRHAVFSHSSWIREMQLASDKSIMISEILDSRNRNMVFVSRISDYVLSNELVSMALAMVAEDKQINRVFEELFAEEVCRMLFSEGYEMCIRPPEFYLYDQEKLCFYEIMIRGRQRQEIVIGYRHTDADRAVINLLIRE